MGHRAGFIPGSLAIDGEDVENEPAERADLEEATELKRTTADAAAMRNGDEMRALYSKARRNLVFQGLNKENIVDLVNTIIRRKRLKMTVCQVMTDYFLSAFPYRSLRRMPLPTATLERRRLFSKASSMLKS